ncbi:restriction endonuclease subunit S [Prevotella sp.]|uniref:restriction endonuclease subunit S n=1 Tax=Prevotella sp. TaxID=59823 RepID=UPI0025F9B6A0|nr:restriction endonuclease subunit S [Prevotella sp.]
MIECSKYKLSECCLSISDGDHLPPPKVDAGIPFITISDIDSSNRLNLDVKQFVPEEYYNNLKDIRKAQRNDILYSVVGSFGIPVIIKGNDKFVFQRHIAILRPDPTKVIPDYLFYIMKSYNFYMQADSVAIGAAQRTISLTALRNMTVELPSMDVQKKIATILSRYDSLIDNYQKQIKLLEEAAQRLYKEWFVNLRFPGHESTKIVDGVPEGWEKKKLGSIAPILTGKKDANYGTLDGNYPFFTCSQEPIKAPSYSFDAEAVLLAGNGDFNVKLYRGRFEAYQRTYVLIPSNADLLYVLYNSVAKNMVKLANGASGSTIKFLTKRMIENIDVLVPTNTILNEYNSLRRKIQQDLENIKSQLRLLTESRDRLLPKLLSGEIEV